MKLDARIQKIELILSDVDGVLTDGGLIYGHDGRDVKVFHVRDGLGIKIWRAAGFHFGLVTARSSHVVKVRAAELGIELVRQGHEEKFPVVEQIVKDLGMELEQLCYIGDDLADLACIEAAGLGATVADGVADIALTVPSYTPGVFPDFDVFELPGFATSTREGSLAALELYQEGQLRGYEDYYVVAMYTSGAYQIHTRDPMATIDELAGRRIRVAGQIQTAVIEALGGVPQNLGAGEMAENIDRGLIDGAMTDASVARTFRVADVAPNHYDSNLGVLVFTIVMNRDVYDSMPDHVKDLLAQSGQFIADRQIAEYGAAIDANMAAWRDDPAHTVVTPSDADRAEIAARVQPVIDQVAAAATPGLIEAYTAKLEDIRAR